MKFKDRVKKYLITEMSMPVVRSAEDGATMINKYAPMVMKGNVKGDVRGPIVAALKAIGQSNNPEKYEREIKMAKKAIQKLNEYKKTKSNMATTSSDY